MPASVEEAWDVLLDVERIAPCLPGAAIEGRDGDRWRGTMKVKIGPITAAYEGTIEIAEADETAHRAVLRAEARDSRGRGGASATITSTMEPGADGTRLDVETDLRVTGPAAQFGRGVMQEVSAKMMDRFADCLAGKMGGGEAPSPGEEVAPAEAPPSPPAGALPTASPLPPDVPAPPPSEPKVRLPGGEEVAPEELPGPPAPAPTEEVLDLAELSRGAVVKRAAPLIAVAALAGAALVALRRRRR